MIATINFMAAALMTPSQQKSLRTAAPTPATLGARRKCSFHATYRDTGNQSLTACRPYGGWVVAPFWRVDRPPTPERRARPLDAAPASVEGVARGTAAPR